MSESRIDPNLRVGRFPLGDVVRALGFTQWFLTNIAGRTELCGPVLAEILAAMDHVGAVQADGRSHGICYENVHHLWTPNLQPRLTAKEAEELIARVVERAEELNADWMSEFFFEEIYLFGSCLEGAERPGDVDLGVVIRYKDGDWIPEPSYYPFANDEPFHHAVRQLANRQRRKLSIHDVREMQSIGAAHRLIWTAKRGRVENAPRVQATEAKRETRDDDRERQQQEALDALAARIQAVKTWPEMPVPELDEAPGWNRTRWQRAQSDEVLLGVAHVRCLPKGNLRARLERELEEKYAAPEPQRWRKAQENAAAYLKACLQFNPWSLRANGRLLRRGGQD